MIYKIYLIDGDNGISILETTFKEFQKSKIGNEVIPGFFKEINQIIDNIQDAMAKGKRSDEIIRTVESEDSTIVIYYHPTSRILFCSISDSDDNTDKLIEVIHKIANRFWKKHQSDIKIFRTTTERSRFQTINTDIENLTFGGKIAEVFPTLLIAKKVLEKILSMGMINDFDFKVALKCTGEKEKNSPLKIARYFNKTRTEINEILKKLAELDIIKM
ncbi:MAG: hypothetical protein ACFFEO_17635 [Candidatus Thorarchaeota archaeon]